MEVGSVVRAIFDFCPSVSEELTLFAGDVIEVLSVIDEFWLLGNKEGITGQFPVSFVEALTIPNVKHGEKLYVCTSDFTSHEPGALSLQRGDLVVQEGSLASSWLQGRNCWGSKGFFPLSCIQEFFLSSRSRQLCQSLTLEFPSYGIGQARAIMGLSAQLEEELDFREGDLITITGVPESGWFEGELNGRRGIFPEGFVELLSPLRMTDNFNISGSGDGFDGKTMTGLTSFPVDNNNDNEKNEKDENQEGTYAIALYKFQAIEQRELDFDVGDRIKIISTLEDGWLEGELYGNRGIFPYRFVKFENIEKVPDNDLPVGTKNNDLHDTMEYSEESSPYLHIGTDPHYWDVVHIEDHSSFPIIDSQEQQLNPEFYSKSNKETLLNYCEDINNMSTKPQLPPRPQSRVCSPPNVQALVQKPKKINNAEQSNGRARVYQSNWAQETWSSKIHPSIMTVNEKSYNPNNISDVSKAKTNRKKSLPYQEIVHWVEDQRKKSKTAASGSKDHHKSPSTWSSLLATDTQTNEMYQESSGSDLIDLDTKLSEQLSQFEKSLSNPRQNSKNKVSRHFSILDYNSETDIIRGLPQIPKHQKSPEKRRILRPPPPRPSTRSNSTTYLSVRRYQQKSDCTQGTSSAIPFKPSRPAPLPPPCSQRNTPSPKPQPRTGTPNESLSLSNMQDDMDATSDELNQLDKEQSSAYPFLLLKMEEVERDLDAYRNTRDELSLMLEEDQDEITRAETLENLEFCDSNIESLDLELQQLRGKTYM